MDETTVVVIGMVVLGAFRFARNVLERYFPNTPEKIVIMRAVGFTDAQIREQLRLQQPGRLGCEFKSLLDENSKANNDQHFPK